jgi:hypothetical protein
MIRITSFDIESQWLLLGFHLLLFRFVCPLETLASNSDALCCPMLQIVLVHNLLHHSILRNVNRKGKLRRLV